MQTEESVPLSESILHRSSCWQAKTHFCTTQGHRDLYRITCVATPELLQAPLDALSHPSALGYSLLGISSRQPLSGTSLYRVQWLMV